MRAGPRKVESPPTPCWAVHGPQLLLTCTIVPAAVGVDLVAALLLTPVWGLGYVESLRGLLFFTGFGLMFFGGAVAGSGRIVHDWKTHYISSRGARALA